MNNAGVRDDNLMIFLQSEQWHKVINTTLDGFFYVTRRVLRSMLTKRVAPRKVTVNAIAPGFIKSDMTKDLNEAELKKTVPLGRFGEPQEVADLVSFLASPKAAYITGQTISITGGLY